MLEKPGCVICEYVIKELQTFIGQDTSEAKIEKALEKVRFWVGHSHFLSACL